MFFLESFIISNKIAKLDKDYADLSEFKLEAPFDIRVIDNYQIRSLSTSSHIAIDFFGEKDATLIPFLAMQDGVVTKIRNHIMYNQAGTDNWAIEIEISINSRYQIHLNFETFNNTDEVKRLQEENIFVKVGDSVEQGDLIGNLIIRHNSAHVHFDLNKQKKSRFESFVVPEPYFSDNAMSLINNVFQKWNG